ncbi:hypothetical protein GCM10027093_26410 [Paraburkholderia jirisanensis]
MLTITQQRHSLTVTENRIIQAKLKVSEARNLIHERQQPGPDPIAIHDTLVLAERALENLSHIKRSLMKSIELKERDLAKIMGLCS